MFTPAVMLQNPHGAQILVALPDIAGAELVFKHLVVDATHAGLLDSQLRQAARSSKTSLGHGRTNSVDLFLREGSRLPLSRLSLLAQVAYFLLS